VTTHLIIERTSTCEDYTLALAAGLADILQPGDVIALEGDLGAGKTTFVRGLATALSINPAHVSSPTFVFINHYPIPQGTHALSRGHLTHVDAYRLTSTEDLDALGWDRLFDPTTRRALDNSAAVIEWPRRIEPALPPDAAWIEISASAPTTRHLRLGLPANWEKRERLDWLREREPIACRVTNQWVPPTSPTYPFATDRARDADLYQWFTGGYKTSREPRPTDEENT
jgi:tRNA threonylcarbamoyladenosine biosynthesis protein TsaE